MEDFMQRKILFMIIFLTGLVAGGIVIVLLLQGPGEPAMAQSDGGERVDVIAIDQVINGEQTAGEVRVTYEDSSFLPAVEHTVAGILVSEDGDFLTIGTGRIEVEVGVEAINDEKPVTTVNAVFDGPERLVRVTADTVIYRDTTPQPELTAADLEAGSKVVPQTLTLSTLDELGENTTLRVWGTIVDDTIIADLLVFENIR
jgi:ABC-type Na+ efflux pump permease subunit